MNDIQVKTGVLTDLKFQVDVEGTPLPVREVRLSIITGSMKFSYLGKLKGNVVSFSISGLEDFVKVGETYNFDLEVYIGNQYFAPFAGKMEIIEAVSVNADMITTSLTKVSAQIQMESGDQKKKVNVFQGGSLTEMPPTSDMRTLTESIINRLFRMSKN